MPPCPRASSPSFLLLRPIKRRPTASFHYSDVHNRTTWYRKRCRLVIALVLVSLAWSLDGGCLGRPGPHLCTMYQVLWASICKTQEFLCCDFNLGRAAGPRRRFWPPELEDPNSSSLGDDAPNEQCTCTKVHCTVLCSYKYRTRTSEYLFE